MTPAETQPSFEPRNLRVLHLEDYAKDAFLLQAALERYGIQAGWLVVRNAADYQAALRRGGLDLILSDNSIPGFNGREALLAARKICPRTPFIFVSGANDETQALAGLAAGATDYVSKDHPWQLVASIRRILSQSASSPMSDSAACPNEAMRRLVAGVQELSLARNLAAVMDIVHRVARELIGADGATFILRDGDQSHYAEENAIGPLWKGRKFPLPSCIGGWVMLNRQPAVISDIYADARISPDAYRPTFVKSLVMVPIRRESPIGAIGNYWATPHFASREEVDLLQTLADTVSRAMENIQVHSELEQRLRERTLQIEAANHELEAFSYSVSHDLKAPLRHVSGYAGLLAEEYGAKLDPTARGYLGHIEKETQRMGSLIEDLLGLARFARVEPRIATVSLSRIVRELGLRLQADHPGRAVDFAIQDGLDAHGDPGLLRVVLDNLLSNAWKYTAKAPSARVEFGASDHPDGGPQFFVRDNGAGFDMRYANRLFGPFQRLHNEEEFTGGGMGLATAQRIIHRHGGRIWAEAEVDKGATFFFTLPRHRLPE